MMQCMCGATDCRSCGPAQGYSPDEEAIEARAKEILDTLLADPAQIAAAHWELNDDEYRAIDQAHAERDAMKLFAERDKAVQRVLAKWAREAAGSEYLAEKEEAAACMED